MSTAVLPGQIATPRSSGSSPWSLATVALFAVVLLVYVSGSFLVAEIAGVKRELQVVLIAPLALAGAYYWINRPGRLLDPLIAFVAVKVVTEIVFRGEWIWILDSVGALLALTVLMNARAAVTRKAADFLVIVAGVFAWMAILQGVALFAFPDLGRYGLIVTSDVKVLNTVQHPIAVLGLFGEQQYTLLGHPIARLQSFAKEPSLNVVYFLLPACVAFLRDTRTTFFFGCSILAYCVLSLSGSIFLSLAFAGVWWSMLRILPLNFAFLVGLPTLVVSYLLAVRSFGLDAFIQVVGFAARYGDFLDKGESLTSRTSGAVSAFESALATPLGSTTHPDLPGPWLVNSALEAGWLGSACLVVFLYVLSKQLATLAKAGRSSTALKMGSLLILGTISTIVVFNDYQMSNYAGLVLIAFVYQTMRLRNTEAGPR